MTSKKMLFAALATAMFAGASVQAQVEFTFNGAGTAWNAPANWNMNVLSGPTPDSADRWPGANSRTTDLAIIPNQTNQPTLNVDDLQLAVIRIPSANTALVTLTITAGNDISSDVLDVQDNFTFAGSTGTGTVIVSGVDGLTVDSGVTLNIGSSSVNIGVLILNTATNVGHAIDGNIAIAADGVLQVSEDTELDGTGTVTGSSSDSVLQIDSGFTLGIDDVTIQGEMQVIGSGTLFNDGEVRADGGIIDFSVNTYLSDTSGNRWFAASGSKIVYRRDWSLGGNFRYVTGGANNIRFEFIGPTPPANPICYASTGTVWNDSISSYLEDCGSTDNPFRFTNAGFAFKDEFDFDVNCGNCP